MTDLFVEIIKHNSKTTNLYYLGEFLALFIGLYFLIAFCIEFIALMIDLTTEHRHRIKKKAWLRIVCNDFLNMVIMAAIAIISLVILMYMRLF